MYNLKEKLPVLFVAAFCHSAGMENLEGGKEALKCSKEENNELGIIT